MLTWGSLGGLAVWRLPSAQGVILESWDQVPHRAPSMEPASPSACVSDFLSYLSKLICILVLIISCLQLTHIYISSPEFLSTELYISLFDISCWPSLRPLKINMSRSFMTAHPIKPCPFPFFPKLYN